MSTTVNWLSPARAARSGRADKRLYMLVLPATLLWGASAACWARSEAAFALAALAVAAVGSFTFGDLLFGSTGFSCGKVMAVGLSLGYGLTSVYTWYHVHDLQGGLSAFMGSDPVTLCNGIAAVAAVCALLLVFGEAVEPPLWLDIEFVAPKAAAKWFVIAGSLVVMVAFLRGDLSYMGQTQTAPGRISVLGSFGIWVLPPLFSLTVAVALYTKDRSEKALFWLLLAIQGVLSVALGRRVVIYTVFMGALAVRFCPVSNKGFVLKRILGTGLCVAIFYVASIAFLFLRFAGYEMGEDSPHSLRDRAVFAYHISQTTSYADVSKTLGENVLERGFILGFLADLVKQSQTHEGAGGVGVENSLMSQIPSALWEGKPQFPAEEDLANEVFHTDYPDSANSTLTAGVVDFGLVGMLLYPLAAAALMALFLRQARRAFRPLTAVVIALAGIYQMLNAECTWGDYTLFVRNGLLFALILHFIGRTRPALSRGSW